MNAHTNAGQSAPAFREEPPRREVATVLRRERRVRAELVQLIALLVAVVLALLVPQISIGFWIPASRAIEMLVAVGAGTVTFIGVVFSLLFLVVQFGSTAFSPRLNLFRDAPIVWRAFSLFTAIVAYSFTAAIVIGGDERTSALVPIVAFAGVIASIVAYRQLQLGAFKSIQLASTLAQIAARGRTVLDGFYTAPAASSVPADVIGCQGPCSGRCRRRDSLDPSGRDSAGDRRPARFERGGARGRLDRIQARVRGDDLGRRGSCRRPRAD